MIDQITPEVTESLALIANAITGAKLNVVISEQKGRVYVNGHTIPLKYSVNRRICEQKKKVREKEKQKNVGRKYVLGKLVSTPL